MANEDLRKAAEILISAKAVIVIIGAGVSVAAGIPTFRGLNKANDVPLPQGRDIKDIMSTEIMTDAVIRAIHCKFIASLARKACLAKPTDFHRLLFLLNATGTLKRLYSQNIDGLEQKAGFNTEEPQPSYIALHGSVDLLRCDKCSLTRPLQNYIHLLDDGKLPGCPGTLRSAPQLRKIKACGKLYPNVILYKADVPDSDLITNAVLADVSSIKKAKSKYLILVVGTTLLVPGAQQIVKSLSGAARRNEGEVIYIDLETKLPDHMLGNFTSIVKGDCEEFARDAMSVMKKRKGKEIDPFKQSTRTDAERRADLRPLWGWI